MTYHNQLHDSGHPLSERDKCHYFINNVTDQRFVNLAVYCRNAGNNIFTDFQRLTEQYKLADTMNPLQRPTQGQRAIASVTAALPGGAGTRSKKGKRS